jgi:catechol 2,3-dioxygenase-like lactoylglutathione lyase family enzyme
MERPTHLGLRHLALNVRDLAGMKRFYQDLLGFVVEWEPDAENIYLTSGTDNLALHLSTKEIGAASPLDHLGLIVREPEDVDRWATFLEERGVAMVAQPRTHRDGARSCYFHDPDGNSVQVIFHPPISGKI